MSTVTGVLVSMRSEDQAHKHHEEERAHADADARGHRFVPPRRRPNALDQTTCPCESKSTKQDGGG
jgi:hypothetical protein